MAIKLVKIINRWNGISSDIKPSSAIGATEGSTFHYIDTGEEFIYHNGMWEDDLRNRNVLNKI